MLGLCCYAELVDLRKQSARRFNADHSALSRATQRVSRDPELLSATKTIQRELEFEINQQ